MKRTIQPPTSYRRPVPPGLALLIALIVQCSTLAQCTENSCAPPPAANPAVVRVAATVAGRSRCYGSGTLVHKEAGRAIVLSCAHLFQHQPGEISVTFPDGNRFEAELVAVDRAWDLAALKIAVPQATPVPIAVDSPRPGDQLLSCGYGSDGRYWCNRGRALGYVRTTDTSTHETLELSGSARDGDSGGPVFNTSGELVAVLWGTNGRMVGGTYCGRIRKFLSGILAPGSPRCPPAESPPPATVPPPGSTGPRASGDRLDEIRRRLDELEEALQETQRQETDRRRSWADRLDKVEQALGLVAGLKDRIQEAERTVEGENLRALVRDVAGGIVADRGPGIVDAVLPAVLAALAWTGPPSIAAIFAIKLALGVLRRRRSKRKRSGRRRATRDEKPHAGDGRTGARKLNDDYAEQLARVYALSGRSPMADVTLGREYDQELRRAEQTSDAALARWARALRQRVARRLYRIHDESPLPSEPPNDPERPSAE